MSCLGSVFRKWLLQAGHVNSVAGGAGSPGAVLLVGK
jgi:hypothetical protein